MAPDLLIDALVKITTRYITKLLLNGSISIKESLSNTIFVHCAVLCANFRLLYCCALRYEFHCHERRMPCISYIVVRYVVCFDCVLRRMSRITFHVLTSNKLQPLLFALPMSKEVQFVNEFTSSSIQWAQNEIFATQPIVKLLLIKK